MYKTRYTLLTLLLFTLICTSGRAQITLNGTVQSQVDKLPLPGAYVYPKNDLGKVTTTDKAGHFDLKLEQPDTILVSFLGFQAFSRYVTASDTGLVFKLLPASAASMDAVTVRARKIPSGELASTQISQLDIYLNPAANADPLLAVNTLPAATNVDETANVSLRGSPSAATGVYLNEVPIRSAVRLDQSNGVGQFSIFGQIPLSAVRIYASSPPVNFSQTSAGAVALYTSKMLPTERTSGLSLNLAGGGLSHARPLGKKSGIRAFINFSNLDAFRRLNRQGLPELKASSGFDAAVQLVHQFDDNSALQLFYLGFNERFRFETTTPYYSGDFEQHKPRHLAILNWQLDRGDWSWTLNQSVDWENAEYRFGNSLTAPRRLTGHLATHGQYSKPGVKLLTGGTWNVYADRVKGQFPLTGYELRPEDPSGSFTENTDHQLAEAYAYTQLRLGDKWLAGFGLKPLYRPMAGEVKYTVQASVKYRAGNWHRFNLGGGTFAQFLAPGPDIREWQWLELQQAALEYTYERRFWQVEAAVFIKQESYEQLPDLKVSGAEGRVTFDDKSLRAWASLALVKSKSVAGDIPSRRDLPFLARAQVQKELGGNVNIGIAATWRRGTYFLPVIGQTPLPGTEGWQAPVFAAPFAGERHPNYRRIDLSTSKILPLGEGQLILYLSVNNLLDTENIRNYTYDATYLERSNEVFTRRIVFVGGVYNW
ncbi:carboxypeptidase-like regulatory domain-containing protein [Neolewinella persica]|uniref:carboxypeptidase-like regulatory domain-containing protein n=1 Tax=Neolewinella persica TaxID=70998 RepID=UPI0003A48AE1|nr:carboxypeptidase-like regulatory domain-containing protein [Neolewinella persica]